VWAAAGTALADAATDSSPSAFAALVSGPVGERDLPDPTRDVAAGVLGTAELPRLLAVTAAPAARLEICEEEADRDLERVGDMNGLSIAFRPVGVDPVGVLPSHGEKNWPEMCDLGPRDDGGTY
jgi:hypothetical protein